MDIREFAEKFIEAEEAAFQRGEFKALEELEDPNVVYHMGPVGDLVGREAHKQDILGTRQATTDLQQEFKYLTGDGNVFAITYTSSCRFTSEKPGFPMPIGKRISGDYLFVVQLKNGKITEGWLNGSINITD